MVVLFPTYARRTSAGWTATVAGMVVRPLPEQSRRRALAVAVLRRLVELPEAHLDDDVFRRRAEAFLFQRQAGRHVQFVLGGRVVAAGQSDRSGHFRVRVELDAALVDAVATVSGPADRRIACSAALVDADDPVPAAAGTIQLVDEVGLSVISDIDDTVKVTNVADRRELLRNTLVREFAAVPGMARAYRAWQESGAAFHYVSSSPWQLSRCLAAFLAAAGLPAGSLHLKLFRLKDSTPLGRLPSRKRSKRRAIEQIMDDFPGRRFVLVGDCGERDPEVYAAVARRRPGQVAAILIREVESRTPRGRLHARIGRLAGRLPAGTLRLFADAGELAGITP